MRDEINLKTNKQIIEINYAYLVNQEEWLFIGFTFSNTIAVVDESYTRIYLYEFFFFAVFGFSISFSQQYYKDRL